MTTPSAQQRPWRSDMFRGLEAAMEPASRSSRGVLVLTLSVMTAVLANACYGAGLQTQPTTRPATAPANPAADEALHRAIKADQLDLVRTALAEGADVVARDHVGVPALHRAAGASVQVMEALLAAGGDVDARIPQGKDTVLMAAALWGSPEMVRLLLEKGAEINATSGHGLTALHHAMFHARTPAQVTEVLLRNGADSWRKLPDGQTALHFAATRKRRDMAKVIKLLIESGADVNAKDLGDRTPLSCARRANQFDEIIRMLVDNGAKE